MIIEQLYLISKQPLFVFVTRGDDEKRKKRTCLKLDGYMAKKRFNLRKIKNNVIVVNYKNF